MSKKKKPKNPGLNPLLTYKHRRWANDQDYSHRLSEEDKIYLNKFMDEYYNNTFRRDGTDLHDDTQRKQLYNRTNASFRDAMHQWDRVDITDIPDKDKDEDEE